MNVPEVPPSPTRREEKREASGKDSSLNQVCPDSSSHLYAVMSPKLVTSSLSTRAKFNY